MASDIKEAIRRMIYQYVVEGADKVMSTQQAVAASTEKTDKASLSLEKSFGNLERRYVDTVRAQQDYQKVQEKVNAAVAQNPELQERANVVLAAASEHYDKLGSRASKSNLAISFTAKAFGQLVGAAGLMGLAMEAVGVAATYVGEQFMKSSTTVEQALAEQNRLMAEATKLIDAKTSAQDRMFAQSSEVTTLLTLQNEVDLREKLRIAMEKAQAVASQKIRPLGEPGAEAQGLTGPLQTAGFEQVAQAMEKLRAAQAAGTIGLKEFNTELAKIAIANPAIRLLLTDVIKTGDAVEQAKIKNEAWLAVLAGTATEAQRVAAGLKTIAQTNFDDLKAIDAALALERMANAMDDLATKYPALSIEGAKQVELLNAQLDIAKARTTQEQLLAQEKAKILQLTLEGVDAEEAALRASLEREIAEANIARQKEEASLREAQQRVDADKRAADAADAAADSVRELGEGIRGGGRGPPIYDAAREVADTIKDWNDGVKDTGDGISHATRATQELGAAIDDAAGGMQRMYTLAEAYVETMMMIPTSFGEKEGRQFVYGYDPFNTALQKEAQERAFGAQNVEPYMVGGTLIGYQVTKEWIDAQLKLATSTEENTSATDALNNTMQNALSPFYSQDPRTTHLGFRAGVVGNPEWMVAGASNTNPLAAILGAGATAPGMANGGSFMVGGGYSANDNRIAAFPVASGEEVIVNRSRKGGEGGQVIHIDNRTIINGRVDSDVFAQMKVSKYQQTQRMRAGLAVA